MAKPLARTRALPWAVMLSAAVVARDHWLTLEEKDRARMLELMRDSRGWPGNLTSREREELSHIARQIDLLGMGRDVAFSRRRGRRRR
ncbi:MAG TPA: hypothetical protein VHX88_14295 [Solirubrobacteraceae bacterium]|jgi:hypothetical protein|nr:hypothetical protein [Solirubrobacteraceae bacterium]